VEGEAVATKILSPGQSPSQVKSYKAGDYFGELALLHNEPRAANVLAKTKLKVVSLERNSFKRLLGPLEDILKRNMDSYLTIVK
jgi:cAMP-dependent protein kinase regulator